MASEMDTLLSWVALSSIEHISGLYRDTSWKQFRRRSRLEYPFFLLLSDGVAKLRSVISQPFVPLSDCVLYYAVVDSVQSHEVVQLTEQIQVVEINRYNLTSLDL